MKAWHKLCSKCHIAATNQLGEVGKACVEDVVSHLVSMLTEDNVTMETGSLQTVTMSCQQATHPILGWQHYLLACHMYTVYPLLNYTELSSHRKRQTWRQQLTCREQLANMFSQLIEMDKVAKSAVGRYLYSILNPTKVVTSTFSADNIMPKDHRCPFLW